MTKSCEKFIKIMSDYRAGKFGKGSMYLNEILTKVGEPELFQQLNESDLKALLDARQISNIIYSHALKALRERQAHIKNKNSGQDNELAATSIF